MYTTLAAIAVLVVFAVMILFFIFVRPGESMTRIRRTVGVVNTANETQVAPGIVNSVPIMDYRYTWTDGIRIYSCDECPSRGMCLRCPQFHVTPIESMEGGSDASVGVSPVHTLVAGESPDHGHGDNLGKTITEVKHRAPVNISDTQSEFTDDDLNLIGACSGRELLPAFDLDPEFVSSRERVGCGGASIRVGKRFYGVPENIGINNDCIADGDRMVLPGVTCSKGVSSTKLLYNNVLGLPSPSPFTASCEFLGPQGYLYKETCALGLLPAVLREGSK